MNEFEAGTLCIIVGVRWCEARYGQRRALAGNTNLSMLGRVVEVVGPPQGPDACTCCVSVTAMAPWHDTPTVRAHKAILRPISPDRVADARETVEVVTDG